MSKIKALIHSWIVKYAYWNCRRGVFGFERWFREQLTYYILDFGVANDSTVYRMELFGIPIDFRKWYVFIPNLEDDPNIEEHAWFRAGEVEDTIRFRPECKKEHWMEVPWYIRFSNAMDRWRFRRNLQWITIGWILKGLFTW